MGAITILDTGYIKPTNTGTRASTENIAANGTAVSLKTSDFIPNIKRFGAVQPDLSSNEPSEANLGSVEDVQFKLRCRLNNTKSADMAQIPQLIDMIKTNGYKVMWYNYVSELDEKNDSQAVYQMALNNKIGTAFTSGELALFGIPIAFKKLNVLFNNMQVRQTSKTLIEYELTGVILPVETSGI